MSDSVSRFAQQNPGVPDESRLNGVSESNSVTSSSVFQTADNPDAGNLPGLVSPLARTAESSDARNLPGRGLSDYGPDPFQASPLKRKTEQPDFRPGSSLKKAKETSSSDQDEEGASASLHEIVLPLRSINSSWNFSTKSPTASTRIMNPSRLRKVLNQVGLAVSTEQVSQFLSTSHAHVDLTAEDLNQIKKGADFFAPVVGAAAFPLYVALSLMAKSQTKELRYLLFACACTATTQEDLATACRLLICEIDRQLYGLDKVLLRLILAATYEKMGKMVESSKVFASTMRKHGEPTLLMTALGHPDLPTYYIIYYALRLVDKTTSRLRDMNIPQISIYTYAKDFEMYLERMEHIILYANPGPFAL